MAESILARSVPTKCPSNKMGSDGRRRRTPTPRGVDGKSAVLFRRKTRSSETHLDCSSTKPDLTKCVQTNPDEMCFGETRFNGRCSHERCSDVMCPGRTIQRNSPWRKRGTAQRVLRPSLQKLDVVFRNQPAAAVEPAFQPAAFPGRFHVVDDLVGLEGEFRLVFSHAGIQSPHSLSSIRRNWG